MLHTFYDKNNDMITFDFDSYGRFLVEINVYKETNVGYKISSSSCREIKDNKIIWIPYLDIEYISQKAMNYCDRLARLSVFH